MSSAWRKWIRDEPCVSPGVSINGMFHFCLTFCCHNISGSWIHVRAGYSSHIWLYKFWVTRKKRHKHKHMKGDPRVPPNSPGSCSPAGWALHMPWVFVLVLIGQCQRSLRRHGTATKIHCHCQSFAWQALQTDIFSSFRSWVFPEAGLEGQEGFHPSVVPLPCFSPCLCCSFLWQEIPNRSCRWGFILLDSSGKPWKPCRAAEAALCLLKGYNRTPWSILPSAMGIGRIKVYVYIFTRMCRQCKLCLVVFCGWRFFVCFAGRHKQLLGSLAHLVWYCHTQTLCSSVLAAAETCGVTQQFYLQFVNPPHLIFLQMKCLSYVKGNPTESNGLWPI